MSNITKLPAPIIDPPAVPTDDLSITPFPDGAVVKAYPHPKFEGQFIIADSAGNIFAVTPSVQKAQLIFESINAYIRAAAMHKAELDKQAQALASRFIKP